MTDDPLRVLVYVRQSEANPGEDAKTSLSLRSQEDRGRNWCATNNATVLAVIADHDLRGHDAIRPGIRQLLDAAEQHRADAVWVLSLSRFARDHILQELVWRDLQARGVKHLISEIESGTDDPFIRGIHGLMHAKSRTEMSAHLKGAFARRARDGGFPVGPTPIAFRRPHRIAVNRANGTSYVRETGEPEIDPDGAAFVLDLFTRFDAGASLHVLACELAAQGPGPRGGAWTRRTVKRILQSPIYVGDISHKGSVVAHDDRWQVVSRDLFDRVQTKMNRAVVVRNNRDRGSWLEGLVLHACGQRMYWQRYTSGGTQRVPEQSPGWLTAAVLDDEHDRAAEVDVYPSGRKGGIVVPGDGHELVVDADAGRLDLGVSDISSTMTEHGRHPKRISGMFLCRTYSDTARCPHGRRIIGAKLLETVVRDCLLRDLGHMPPPATALEMAQERAGGPDGVKSRTRIERALTTAQDRWRRNHERFSAGKLPPDVMDVEDGLLATAERVHVEALAAMPKPPNPGRISATHRELSAMRTVLETADGETLRGFVEALGTVTVGECGIGIDYFPEAAALVPSPTRLIVPVGGKGFR